MRTKHLLAALCGLLVPVTALAATAAPTPPPTTEFEQNGGAGWTSHQGELSFLAAVDAASDRVAIEELGRTAQGRPIQLVKIGDPAPRTAAELAASDEPTLLLACSVHGNEPSGREACLRWLRDLAFTTDPTLVRQLREQTILVIPTANPDGRQANSRGNSRGTDVNRDHLNLTTEEAKAMALAVREWGPDVAADLHEYGPSIPGVYDDDLLYLWPRNKNVDPMVRWAAKTLSEDYIVPGVEASGYRAGEYGVAAAGDDVTGQDYHLAQTAGDEDEGIARNGWALKHTASILLETAVVSLAEEATPPLVRQRRAETHFEAVRHILRYMRELGPATESIRDLAGERKTKEGAERSAPVYFNGQDQDSTVEGMVLGSRADSTSVDDTPPCGYALTASQVSKVAGAAALHGTAIDLLADGSGFVSMAQPTEPLIPLLLDARGSRDHVQATPLDDCSAFVTG